MVRLVVTLLREKVKIFSWISVIWDLGGGATKSRKKKQMKKRERAIGWMIGKKNLEACRIHRGERYK